MANITIHTDGASRGNPGPSAIAYVIEGLDSGKIEHAEKIGATTNNQAEYRALLAAITKLCEQVPTNLTITFFGDSELMIKQLRGEYKVKDVNIAPHYAAITAIKRQLELAGNTIKFTAVRREQNKRADELGNMALDGTF